MGRAVLILDNDAVRLKATSWVQRAPEGTRLEFKASKRTLPQNDYLWSLLTEIAEQKDYHGIRLHADDWKLLFLDALKREVRMVPNLDGNGFVSLGRSSSDLSKAEMADLLELIMEWGARNGVVFKEPGSSPSPEPAEPTRPLPDPRVGSLSQRTGGRNG